MALFTLVTGGSRSGKSAFAQGMAEEQEKEKIFIATCPHTDPEMNERIRLHKFARQGRGWQSIEEPLLLTDCLGNCPGNTTVLIDCLTLWINNLLYEAEKNGRSMTEDRLEQLAGELAKQALDHQGLVIMVTGEVGSGVVPDNALARRYRDLVGRCNQTMAGHADRVFLVSCGLPLQLK